MFPVTDLSATIVDCLVQAARESGVTLRTGTQVQSVVYQNNEFQIRLKTGEQFSADAILLATGSSPQGYAIAQSLGHSLVQPVPSLFTLNIRDSRLAELAGVAVANVHLRLQMEGRPTLEQTGPLLITHWGVSGPAVLKLSAWGARVLHDNRYQGTLRINWLPQMNPEVLRQQLIAVRSQLARKTVFANCPVPIPRRLWEKLVTHVRLEEGKPDIPHHEMRWAELSNKTLNRLIQELTQGHYAIVGKGVFKEEFVTCGGIPLNEVDFKTMASRRCPGLYLAGEILDIDGVTGGFNFQSAWTTGWLAGQAMGTQ
jgi:hypothetical protein